MTTRLAARFTALGLAAFVTLAVLGSVDRLARFEPAAASVMAAASQPAG
jgi:hypothetical protein